MPLVFTRDQIKSYLEGQGYQLHENELNAFIHDLKRVVKHEDRKRRRKRLGHDPDDTRFETTASTTSPDEGEYYICEEEEDEGVHSSTESPSQREEASCEISDELLCQSVKVVPNSSKSERHSQLEEPTCLEKSTLKQAFKESPRTSSTERAPSTTKKSFIVMDRRTMTYNDNNEPVVVDSKVPILIDVPDKVKDKQTAKKYQIPLTSNTSNIVRKSVEIAKPPLKKTTTKQKENIILTSSSSNSNSLPKSSSSSNTNTDDLLALLQAIMPEPEDTDSDSESVKKRPLGPPDHIKRDPVALYHYYKTIWDKQKVPGQNRHMKLRWNVRAHTVGTYPCINGQPIKYLRQ